ncbi:hypothetical protein SAMN06309944_1602 [Micrococcales bacterium KH10]|nr:hypothetical protein SAMN06309944_1602 [Micrococcales bacterium KH10]
MIAVAVRTDVIDTPLERPYQTLAKHEARKTILTVRATGSRMCILAGLCPPVSTANAAGLLSCRRFVFRQLESCPAAIVGPLRLWTVLAVAARKLRGHFCRVGPQLREGGGKRRCGTTGGGPALMCRTPTWGDCHGLDTAGHLDRLDERSPSLGERVVSTGSTSGRGFDELNQRDVNSTSGREISRCGHRG